MRIILCKSWRFSEIASETCITKGFEVLTVAPRAGAWIETNTAYTMVAVVGVAPRAGAWIETAGTQPLGVNLCGSHPVRVRGLKPA